MVGTRMEWIIKVNNFLRFIGSTNRDSSSTTNKNLSVQGSEVVMLSVWQWVEDSSRQKAQKSLRFQRPLVLTLIRWGSAVWGLSGCIGCSSSWVQLPAPANACFSFLIASFIIRVAMLVNAYMSPVAVACLVRNCCNIPLLIQLWMLDRDLKPCHCQPGHGIGTCQGTLVELGIGHEAITWGQLDHDRLLSGGYEWKAIGRLMFEIHVSEFKALNHITVDGIAICDCLGDHHSCRSWKAINSCDKVEWFIAGGHGWCPTIDACHSIILEQHGKDLMIARD